VTFGYGAKFPAKYQEAFFICDWSYGKLYAVHMTPDGASYKGTAEEFIKGSPLPLTDIVVNPKDGAMYFAVGGRRADSALYRVTYTGAEPTAPAKGDAKGAEARALRRKLEALHGKEDPAAVKVAWPYLGHEDRFIRWAARTAIEHQDTKLWWEKAVKEKEPWAAIEGLVALARTSAPGADVYELQQKYLKAKDADAALRAAIAQKYPDAVAAQPRLLEALGRLDWKQLSRDQKLALLRAYGLAFIRMGRPDDKAVGRLVGKFDALYPAGDLEMNSELARLLVYLQAPSAAAKTMALLRAALTQEEQMDFALSLRNLRRGWTDDLRKEYFRWFVKAAGYKGGNSFGGFVRNIRSEAIAYLTADEKTALKSVLDIPLKGNQPAAVEQRPFVREWKLAELLKSVEAKSLKNRDFEQGRKMFAAANCFACHRFANEGGSTGPDLTGVAGRFNVRDMLEAITDPNKVISDQYQAVVIATEDGRFVTGRIVNLAGDNLMVNTDMLDPNKQTSVNRRTIQSITPSPVSMMPAGLLNTLNEAEVLDLLAYLLSGGNPDHAMFRKE
jgi:putative heme-binding domain-containing protein